jgi:ferrous iron transport protein A
MIQTTLDKLIPGESGKITRLMGQGAIRRRLVDMGLTKGAVIEMVKVSPLGDPVEYRLRGYHLSLRRSEAKTILVDLVEDLTPQIERSDLEISSQPLLRCKSGQRVQIDRIRGGARMGQRLDRMGITPGATICVVQNEFPGPLIISVASGERMILGKGMARHIFVQGEGDCSERIEADDD